MTSLTELLASVHHDGATHTGTAPDTWTQGRTLYGGISAALCLDAVAHDYPELPPLRSAEIAFVGPAGGPITMTTSLLRQGKSAAFVNCDLTTDSGIGTRALFCFGSSRASRYQAAAPSAPVVPTPDASALFFSAERRPNFAVNFEVRLAKGDMIFTGARHSHNFYWVRHVDANEPQTMVALLALADVTPPAATILFSEPAMFSTMTWALDVTDPVARSRDGWWLCGVQADAVLDGYSTQSMSVWNSDGAPALIGRQTVAIFG